MVKIYGKGVCCPGSPGSSSEDLPAIADPASSSTDVVPNRELNTFLRSVLTLSGRTSVFKPTAKKLKSYQEFTKATARNASAAKKALEEINEILVETGTDKSTSHSIAVSVSVFLGMLTIVERFLTFEVPKFLTNPGEYFLGGDWGDIDIGIDYSGEYYRDSTITTTSTTTSKPESELLKGISFSIHVVFTIATIVACCTTLYQCTKQKPAAMKFKGFFGNLFGQTSIANPLEIDEVNYLSSIASELSAERDLKLSHAKEIVSELMTFFDAEFLEFVDKIVTRQLRNINLQALGSAALRQADNDQEKALLLALSWLFANHDMSSRELRRCEDFNFNIELIPDFMPVGQSSDALNVFNFLKDADHQDLIDWYRVIAIGDQLILSHSQERTDRLISALNHSTKRLINRNENIDFGELLSVGMLSDALTLYETEKNTSAIRAWIRMLQSKGSSLSRGQIRG